MNARAALVLFFALTLSACATVDQYFGKADGTIPGQAEAGDEFPQGAIVPAPWGYYEFCAREPESVFCK
jgi:predicted transglutaminase-like cysteine proteinase